MELTDPPSSAYGNFAWPTVSEPYTLGDATFATGHQDVLWEITNPPASPVRWCAYIVMGPAANQGLAINNTGGTIVGGSNKHLWSAIPIDVPAGGTVTVTKTYQIHNLYFRADVEAGAPNDRIIGVGIYREQEGDEHTFPQYAPDNLPIQRIERLCVTDVEFPCFYFGPQIIAVDGTDQDIPYGPLLQPEAPFRANTWWDGNEEQPCYLEGWWDGTTIQPATLDSFIS